MDRRWKVMLSSTGRDLVNYRKAFSQVAEEQDLALDGMERNPAPGMSVTEISLRMVEGCDIFFCLIGLRYGQRPECPKYNPDGRYSIVELEHQWAQSLHKPRHYFIIKAGFDFSTEVFKLISEEQADGGAAEVVRFRQSTGNPPCYVESIDEFKKEVRKALINARSDLERPKTPTVSEVFGSAGRRNVATHLVALNSPLVLQSDLVGRKAELAMLDAFAKEENERLLLVHAIGGMGKSRLLWHWAEKHAFQLGREWAGVFWYSFYEQGTSLKEFLVQALARLGVKNGLKNEDELRRLTPFKLGEQLRQMLDDEPFLFVLDGMERLLVAYDTSGKEALSDEQTEGTKDAMGRNGRDCIGPDDDRILKSLAQTRQSKLVASSRLVPNALLNDPAHGDDSPLLRVRIHALHGLGPEDSASLLESRGVTGNRADMARYLDRTFAGHPLAIGVLPGLIAKFMPLHDREGALRGIRDFDLWVKHKDGGQHPELVSSSLKGRKEHILQVAFASLDEEDAELLTRLAHVTRGYVAETLFALNPHRPPRPETASAPKPKSYRALVNARRNPKLEDAVAHWKDLPEGPEKDEAEAILKEYVAADFAEQEERYAAMRRWPDEVRKADALLPGMLDRLHGSGLLLRDRETRMIDMHPVVRYTVRAEPERSRRGAKAVANAFESRAQMPYSDVKSLADLAPTIDAVQANVAADDMENAVNIFMGGLSYALRRIGERNTHLELLKLFMTDDFSDFAHDFRVRTKSFLLGQAAILLSGMGRREAASTCDRRSLSIDVEQGDITNIAMDLLNLAIDLRDLFRFHEAQVLVDLARRLAEACGDSERAAWAVMNEASLHSWLGRFEQAHAALDALPEPEEGWSFENQFRSQCIFLSLLLAKDSGALDEAAAWEMLKQLKGLEFPTLVATGLQVIGEWCQDQGEHERAEEALTEAITIGRHAGFADIASTEVLRAISLAALGRLNDARQIAREAQTRAHELPTPLAQLHFALGDTAKARELALAGYRQAWAEGAPYSDARRLKHCRDLLARLGEPEPELPPFDPAGHPLPEYVAEVEALIARVAADRAAREETEAGEARRRQWLSRSTALAQMLPPASFKPELSDGEWAALRAQIAGALKPHWHAPPKQPGAWTEPDGEDAVQLVARLSDWLDRAGQEMQLALESRVDRVRTMPLACYPGASLVEMQGYAADGRAGLITLIADQHRIRVLNGTSLPIHALNEATPPDFATAAARREYLELFMNHVCGEEGRFQPVGERDTLAQRLADSGQLDELADQLQPLTQAGEERRGDALHYLYSGTVLYSNGLFRVDIKLFVTGMVEMLDDEQLAVDLPVQREGRAGLLVVKREVEPGQGA
jgi:tetratricopeptide (TPR) repeat protein